MKIAVSGKGGVGKTTLSANIAKFFSKKGYKVYAVDADPDSSLGTTLGIKEEDLQNIKPIVDYKELIEEKTGNGAIFTLNPLLDDIKDKYSIDVNGISFLKMGGVKNGGSACYCLENNFLNALVNSLILDTKEVVILDMGAGIEHLTRGTAKGVDLMIIVTEAGKTSVQTARVVENLSKELEIENIRFVANRIRKENEEFFINSNFTKEELLGIIHYDEKITERAMGLLEIKKEVDNEEINKLLVEIEIEIKKTINC
jgi:CO dehydrogenase maturation factor